MPAISQLDDATKTICWGRGDTDPKTFQINNDAGVAQDISTWTFKLTVNADANPTGTPPPEFTIVGVFVTDGTDGLISFTPADGDTDIDPVTYFYDIERRIGGISIKTLIKGLAEIVQDVTK